MSDPIITLTTDYGSADPLVGTMKGAMLSVNPAARIVDLTHAVEPYDVLDGALALAQAWSYFPEGTIHVVVVDPGVGTARRPILVRAAGHWFVAPDNGVLWPAVGGAESLAAWHITAQRYFRQPVSRTFHGRDIFGPVAAALSLSKEGGNFGPRITSIEKIPFPAPRLEGGRIFATVLRVDHFGNLLTSLTAQHAAEARASGKMRLTVGGAQISRLVETFGEGAKGEAVALVGSSGYLEVAVNQGSAARLLGVGRGSEVVLAKEG